MGEWVCMKGRGKGFVGVCLVCVMLKWWFRIWCVSLFICIWVLCCFFVLWNMICWFLLRCLNVILVVLIWLVVL